MTFRLLAVVLFIATWLGSCKPEDKRKSSHIWDASAVSLSCMPMGTAEEPSYAVYLQVEDRKVKVAEIAVQCEQLEPANFATYDIPGDALSAVGGWWAGMGDYLYVVQEDTALAVYQGFVDDMQEEPGYQYMRIGTFDGKRFTISLPVRKSDLVGLYALSGEQQSWLLFIGLHEDTLTGQFFQAGGALPVKEHLIHYLPTLKPLDLANITLNESTLKFDSAIGPGQFIRMDNIFSVRLDEQTDMRGEPLTLMKIE